MGFSNIDDGIFHYKPHVIKCLFHGKSYESMESLGRMMGSQKGPTNLPLFWHRRGHDFINPGLPEALRAEKPLAPGEKGGSMGLPGDIR